MPSFAETHPKLLYIEQKYGGHLGFYEGGLVCPNHVTWLDRNVLHLADALAGYVAAGSKGRDSGDGKAVVRLSSDSEEEDIRLVEELKLMDEVRGTTLVLLRRRCLTISLLCSWPKTAQASRGVQPKA